MGAVSQLVSSAGGVRPQMQGDTLTRYQGVSSLTTVGAGTITAALLTGDYLSRSGPVAAFTDTTDTAANIAATLAGIYGNASQGGYSLQPGQTFVIDYINTTIYNMTMAAGTGVTLSGPTNVPALCVQRFLVKIDNGTGQQVYTGVVDGTTAVLTGFTAAQVSTLSVGMAATGTGIPASTTVIGVNPAGSVTLSANTTVAGAAVSITFSPRVTITGLGAYPYADIPKTKYTATTAGTAILSAGDITGAEFTVLSSSGGTTPTYTTRTAALMYADMPNLLIGLSYILRVENKNSGTLTLAGGTGVTITGTATVATNTTRDFIVTIASATTVTMQSIGTGTTS